MDESVLLVIAALAVFGGSYLFKRFMDRSERNSRRTDLVEAAASEESATVSSDQALAIERRKAIEVGQEKLKRLRSKSSPRLGERKPITRLEVPDDTDGMIAFLGALARPALVFHRHDVKSDHARHLTYFGGRPITPRDWTWPRSWETGYPLVFICQIDLSSLPTEGAGLNLPREGVVYFFHDVSWNSSLLLGCVNYRSGPTADWIEAHPPADIFGNEWSRQYCKSSRGEEGTAPKVDFVCVAVLDYPSGPDEVSDELRYVFEYRGESIWEIEWDNSIWRDVALDLRQKQREKAARTAGTETVGSRFSQMGGYPSVFVEMDVGSPNVPLLKLGYDTELEIEMSDYIQYLFDDDYSRDWDGVFLLQESS